MSMSKGDLVSGVGRRLAERRISRRTAIAVAGTTALLPYAKPHLTSLGSAAALDLSETADVDTIVFIGNGPERPTQAQIARNAMQTAIRESNGTIVPSNLGGSSYVGYRATFRGVIDAIIETLRQRLESLLPSFGSRVDRAP